MALQQRRAARIAYQYLRDVHDADEAVQDAFVKVFTHITSYREDLPFEVWFTRILVNGCLDLRKARSRRLRWVAAGDARRATRRRGSRWRRRRARKSGCSPANAGARLRRPSPSCRSGSATVFTLCQIGGQSANEVSQALGLSEATVRVHLFRAIRKLRGLLERER